MAVLRNMARIVGRRPVDRHRHRRRRVAQVEPAVEHLHVVEGGDRHARRCRPCRRCRAAGRGRSRTSVTESKAVDSRVAGWPSDRRWKRRLVRKASPSPANMRAGRSPSRLNGNTPAVNGNWPGRFSSAEEPQQVAVVVVAGERDAGDVGARQRLLGEAGATLLIADLRRPARRPSTPRPWPASGRAAPGPGVEVTLGLRRERRRGSRSSAPRRRRRRRPPAAAEQTPDVGDLLGPAGHRGLLVDPRGEARRSRRPRPGSGPAPAARSPSPIVDALVVDRGQRPGRGGLEADGRPGGPAAPGRGR